jgi:hypothetical protein
MRKGVSVLLALLFARAVAARDGEAPAAGEPGTAAQTASAAPLRLPPRETFRLFKDPAPDPRVSLAGATEPRRLFHQAGDPDSLFTLGTPPPDREPHLLAVIDVNETFLKVLAPDPHVLPNDTRPRAPGSFLPFDTYSRPYQLRLGARLVW